MGAAARRQRREVSRAFNDQANNLRQISDRLGLSIDETISQFQASSPEILEQIDENERVLLEQGATNIEQLRDFIDEAKAGEQDTQGDIISNLLETSLVADQLASEGFGTTMDEVRARGGAAQDLLRETGVFESTNTALQTQRFFAGQLDEDERAAFEDRFGTFTEQLENNPVFQDIQQQVNRDLAARGVQGGGGAALTNARLRSQAAQRLSGQARDIFQQGAPLISQAAGLEQQTGQLLGALGSQATQQRVQNVQNLQSGLQAVGLGGLATESELNQLGVAATQQTGQSLLSGRFSLGGDRANLQAQERNTVANLRLRQALLSAGLAGQAGSLQAQGQLNTAQLRRQDNTFGQLFGLAGTGIGAGLGFAVGGPAGASTGAKLGGSIGSQIGGFV